jgi:outer membrane lipoprotein carrier protein
MISKICISLIYLLISQKADLVSDLQNRYDRIKDFKAEFIQSYYSANGTLLMESKGKLYYKKSGMFKWEYETPKAKEFVIKGNKLFVYLKDDGIVYVDEDFKSSQLKLVMLFLYGVGSIEREFNVDKVDEEEEFARILLTPREATTQIARMIMHIRKNEKNVEKLEIIDDLNNRNVFRFKDITFDTGLKESFFNFRIPEGVEVSPIPKDLFK